MLKAIIVDLDRTLCDGVHRDHLFQKSPKDWDTINHAAAYDTPHEWCLELCNLYGAAGYHILFVTARTGSTVGRQVSYDWLARNVGFGFDWTLIMRPEGDYRDDSIVKQDLYNQHVFGQYEVRFCLDDRYDVCSMWRNLGLTALHCQNI